jgi:acetyltransferase-like isoleucine patch superfamily enzyme
MKRLLRRMRNFVRRRMRIASVSGVRLGVGVIIDGATVLEGNNAIGERTVLDGAHVGRFSYVAHDSLLPHVWIGRFCAIADGVRAYLGRHPTDTFVSIHPAFYSRTSPTGRSFSALDRFDEHEYIDPEKRFVTHIGNDVWIGANVILVDGVTVGDGAIVGANSVVTHDLDPYGIYVGSPARLLRKRFDDQTISALLTLRWWDKPCEWISQHAELFDDVRRLLDACTAEGFYGQD